MAIKACVTFDRSAWRWKVYEDHGPGKPLEHHSWHRTEAEARATARAQNVINKRDAASAASA